jgi:hypothetical protein
MTIQRRTRPSRREGHAETNEGMREKHMACGEDAKEGWRAIGTSICPMTDTNLVPGKHGATQLVSRRPHQSPPHAIFHIGCLARCSLIGLAAVSGMHNTGLAYGIPTTLQARAMRSTFEPQMPFVVLGLRGTVRGYAAQA